MTYARREIVDYENVGIYHCISRCVRRAFLCGKDSVSMRSYEHRREWIRERLAKLVGIFAIEVVAYAVMNNHLHSLIRIRPDVAEGWTDEEVALRWRTLFPLRWVNGKAAKPSKEEIKALMIQPDKIATYRERLSSISWFNRCLNENIARRANAEDKCTGRFWEGRFKCQRVLDLSGILACAAYIDLNPIRAGRAKTLESSDHTSIQDRIHEVAQGRPKRCAHWAEVPLLAIEEVTEQRVSLSDYLKLVDETGRLIVSGKKNISSDIAPILERLNIKPGAWVDSTKEFRFRFRRVVGAEDRIRQAALRVGKAWFQGIAGARKIFCTAT